LRKTDHLSTAMEGTVANFYCFLRSSDFQLKNCFASEGESLNTI